MTRISTFAACIVFAIVALSANGASAGTRHPPTNNAAHHASDDWEARINAPAHKGFHNGGPRHGAFDTY
jgi:hypothetical protein